MTADTSGARRPPWYQRPPYPAIVETLFGHELLTEGGTVSLKLAGRLVAAYDGCDPQRRSPVDVVAAALAAERLAGHLESGPRDSAAQDIVDIICEHRAQDCGS